MIEPMGTRRGHRVVPVPESPDAAMSEYLSRLIDRPLGAVEVRSGQTLSPFSSALIAAADNLLDKADRALAAGDVRRATRLIDRAAALPYDEHEECAPAAFAATMLLFGVVTDALEDSDPDDSAWLAAAVQAMAASDGWGRSQLRRTLDAISQDYLIEPAERDEIERAGPQPPALGELRDTSLAPEELASAVTSVLQTAHHYRVALAQQSTPPPDSTLI